MSTSVNRRSYVPEWPTSRSGLCNLVEVIAIVFSLGFLSNLNRQTFYKLDSEYVSRYFSISAMHLGYLSIFVIVNILGDLVPRYRLDYYRKNLFATFLVDSSSHISTWYIFLQLTDQYGYTSDLYASYFLRTFLTIFIWYTRTARRWTY